MVKVLLLVDIQNDFMPGGSLAIDGAHELIPVIDNLVRSSFDLIIATKDWHPVNHGSFASCHKEKKPGDHIILAGVDQVLWPDHCIQKTYGSEFAPNWDTTKISHIAYKGTDPFIDSYSSFFDNAHKKSTDLEKYLKEHHVTDLFIAGVATDYCVKYSVLDAIALGFKPIVIIDACRGVNLNPKDSEEAFSLMQQEGATLIYSKDA